MEEAETDARPVRRKAPPTIYDVAKLTGFSASTVSRALNKPGRINAKTEERIRDAAASIGYQLNPMARALPTGRTDTMAVLISDITNPVYLQLLRGAEHVATSSELTLVFAESQEDPALELSTARRLLPSVDGMLLFGSRLTDDQILDLAEIKPVVLANREVEGVPAIVPEVTVGIRQAVDHLQSLGHRSIGYVSGPATSWMNRRRWEVVFESAVARGLTVVEIPIGDATMAGGEAALPRVLASGVTAVLTYNDLVALGLLRTARAARIDVPGGLSIVGFDNVFGADLTTPTLTSIGTPSTEVGEAAMRRLLGELDREAEAAAGLLETSLVVRESTGPPGAA
ncbi:LacI family DNA-binding transcriptional regulator [Microbacterium ureisolvens]|uniref:LacI family DNA-binding transcriptional regulator n=1 Tax=Microbacterium ureisolvens TaxID=2781186 RepID=A0ABS7HY87_9MICO|nr:LacI family DNA-binding transcriptional regulator [Microbacterium ureisolvens]MBW9110349.1 LacI family DNA-binding transcriptional regulator [Microbacterium ureisolvens]